MRCGPLALLLPQAAQAHGGPQIQRSGLLAAGHVQGLQEAGFRLFLRCPRLLQEQDTPEAGGNPRPASLLQSV